MHTNPDNNNMGLDADSALAQPAPNLDGERGVPFGTVSRLLAQKVFDGGVKVTRVEIRDISPPKDLVESMGRQMKAERDKRAQILEAEGAREAAIQVAQGQKESEILKADGQLEAARREAEARERLAEAEAKATDVVSRAIAEGDARAINYFIAQKYVDALGKLADSNNNKIMMIPLEAASVIGSIAGIGEIARDVFNGDGSNPSLTQHMSREV